MTRKILIVDHADGGPECLRQIAKVGKRLVVTKITTSVIEYPVEVSFEDLLAAAVNGGDASDPEWGVRLGDGLIETMGCWPTREDAAHDAASLLRYEGVTVTGQPTVS